MTRSASFNTRRWAETAGNVKLKCSATSLGNVVLGRDRVEDEVEAVYVLAHLIGILLYQN